MRTLLVKMLSTMASFYLVQILIAGVRLDPTWQAYLSATLVFLIFNLLIAPIIRLLLLPINLLTLGLFGWIANVITLYLFDIFSNSITISPYQFPGFTSTLLALPPAHLSLFWVLVLTSLTLTLINNLITFLLRSEP
ncbi:MAG: hypothetical protein UX38_C0008G0008 [Microgenomates group bacterium GW2011_GWC1_46_16]|uniref:Phage holin family protein n=2 Tax=Candidatus Collieribacteriota TaxID=1752725 RepID=A0A1F5FZ77_9BACT|nr:MAG: hypothetical protein UX32_C0007G0048 [Microgenomates group bacterium GW2011_GWF1_46_12]KKU26175.1 MAG: hypothetical protein UX38_C0008G0008 [Microgenomates group bacterium GW2011_GWC1_46_16]KKU28175.1 MAG: hypothetical protein UX40_C0002G0015 [Microgenomates group bacterium GW2011_GWF2_46_18]KKU43740.1 MAG: hypothetical protein UX59_C0010G0007 [Microgenomates group bacterium GW2011_GWA1_46_7]KKU45608.1 MAG: hypothetical protein UX63_C0003G0034 [Microgenomates group bacterium GW2011_GWB1